MKHISTLINGEGSPLGPGTDLVISLVAVLIMVIAINKKKMESQLVAIEKEQMTIIQNITKRYDASLKEIIDTDHLNSMTKKYRISFKQKGLAEITVENQATLQKFTFGSGVLFGTNEDQLKREGKRMISIVGDELLKRLNSDSKARITEIQVQGHADRTNQSEDPNYNVKMAAKRAIAVLLHLKNTVEIDPFKHLISIASFGEYNPTWREKGQQISEKDLKADRNLERHRRIEVLLSYSNKRK